MRKDKANAANKICFDCATPINGCCWLHQWKPVPGWDAEIVIRYNEEYRKREITYHVKACPLYTRYQESRYVDDNTDKYLEDLIPWG